MMGVSGFLIFLVGLIYFLFPSNKKTIRLERGAIVEAVYSLGTVKPIQEYSLKFGVAAS